MSRLAGKVALITGRGRGVGPVTYASDRSGAEAVFTAITASGAVGARSLFPKRKPVERRFK
jgi:hypothetical protein